jgi:hypothetical protein
VLLSDTIEYAETATTEELAPAEEVVTTPDVVDSSTLILQDPTPADPLPAGVEVGQLVKRPDMTAVYFIDQDNRRHAFPSALIYNSWYSDFSNIETISADLLASIPLGTNVTMRPGTNLIKIQSDPKVYAVEPYGVIRWVESEPIAKALYGDNWNIQIVDVSVAFFGNYQKGSSIGTASHPTGSVIQYAGSDSIYYIENGKKRMVSPSVFTEDLFQTRFVQTGISTSLVYESAADYPVLPAETLMYLR